MSEFDRGRIAAYRNCGLSFRKIGSRVGRNQTTVMRICGRWMQEGTTDLRGRSHLPQCTTSREHRQMCMRVPFDAVHSRMACPQYVHCLVYPLRRTTDISAAYGAMKEGCRRQNGMKLSLLTSHASICNTTMVGFESGDRMLNICVMHHHTGPALDIMVMATAIFQQDNARPRVARIVKGFFVNHQIELLPWQARSPDLSPIENMWSMVAQRLTQITPPAASPDQL
ncbi:transposable element Tcb1 transposase [Trichonephila clavipes]|nr:transposable element Tcb1 transposase [Trichonephila clavipes]